MIDNNKLKEFREFKELTISNVAKKIKRSKKVIEDWEMGNSIPELEDLEKLAKLYEVDVFDFYYKEDKTRFNIFIFLGLIILGFLCCYVIKNTFLYFIVPLVFANVYITYVILKNAFEVYKEDEPKSIFNFKLPEYKKKRMVLYLLECNILGSAYLIFDTICEVLRIKTFIFNIEILSNKDVNKILVFALVYLLFFILSFIIELVFGEYLTKKYKGDKSE